MVSADQNRINYLPRTDTIDHYNGLKSNYQHILFTVDVLPATPMTKRRRVLQFSEIYLKAGRHAWIYLRKERTFFLNMNTCLEDRQRVFSLPLLAAKLNRTPL